MPVVDPVERRKPFRREATDAETFAGSLLFQFGHLLWPSLADVMLDDCQLRMAPPTSIARRPLCTVRDLELSLEQSS